MCGGSQSSQAEHREPDANHDVHDNSRPAAPNVDLVTGERIDPRERWSAQQEYGDEQERQTECGSHHQIFVHNFRSPSRPGAAESARSARLWSWYVSVSLALLETLPPWAEAGRSAVSTSIRRTETRQFRLVLGFVTGLMLVGCGGGSPKSTATSASTLSNSESAASAPVSTATVATDDATTASALMWGPPDFPSGWTSAPHTRSADRQAVNDRLAACAGGVNVVAPVDVDAPDFSSGDLQAEMVVAIQADAATVDADLNLVNGPKFDDCLKAELIRALGAKAQSPGVAVEVTKLPPPAGAPSSSAFVRATVSQNGTPLLVSDTVLTGAGRTELTLVFNGKGTAFDEQLEADLVAKAAARLDAHPT